MGDGCEIMSSRANDLESSSPLTHVVDALLTSLPVAPARLRQLTRIAATVVSNAASGRSAMMAQAALELLEGAVLDSCAAHRAKAMLDAVGSSSIIPLWLVSGPDMLGAWVRWSKSGPAIENGLTGGAVPGEISVSGDIALRTRGSIGGARIRIRRGHAVAPRVQLTQRRDPIMKLGDKGVIISKKLPPEHWLMKFRTLARSDQGLPLADIVKHKLFELQPTPVLDLAVSDDQLIIAFATHRATLAPVPDAALAVLPSDYDPARPWRPTAAESSLLRKLVREGRKLIRTR